MVWKDETPSNSTFRKHQIVKYNSKDTGTVRDTICDGRGKCGTIVTEIIHSKSRSLTCSKIILQHRDSVLSSTSCSRSELLPGRYVDAIPAMYSSFIKRTLPSIRTPRCLHDLCSLSCRNTRPPLPTNTRNRRCRMPRNRYISRLRGNGPSTDVM